jgi:hypothetical protein
LLRVESLLKSYNVLFSTADKGGANTVVLIQWTERDAKEGEAQ